MQYKTKLFLGGWQKQIILNQKSKESQTLVLRTLEN